MGYGYAYNGNWAAITFKMSVNGGGDNVIYDIDGKNIIGYCYAKGTVGLMGRSRVKEVMGRKCKRYIME